MDKNNTVVGVPVNLYKSVIVNLNLYFSILIIGPGIILNILTAIVFRRKPFRNTNLGFFYTGLAIVDAISLSIGFSLFFPLSLGRDITTYHEILCKSINYFRRYFIKLSSWFEVLISFDRIVSVKFNNKIALFKSRKNLWMMVGVLCIFLSIIFSADAIYFIASSQTSTSNSTAIQTTYSCKSTFVAAFISDTISTIFRTIIPFIIMLSTNIIILRDLFHSKSKLRKSSSNSSKSNRERQFTFTVLSLNVIFLITQIPLSIVQLSQNVFKYLPDASPQLLSDLNLYSNIAFMIVYTFQSMQFVINIVFNRLFRNEVLIILNFSCVDSGKLKYTSNNNSLVKSNTQQVQQDNQERSNNF